MKKKNNIKLDDEINLLPLFVIIWDGKIKILLITIISFLVAFGYYSQIPKNYSNSLTINKKDSVEIKKIQNIGRLLKIDGIIQSIDTSSNSNSNSLDSTDLIFLKRFYNELKDYEEFLIAIKNTNKIQEEISNFNIESQEIELFKYAKLLEISELKENSFIINFIWNDPDEAKKILNDTLNLTSKNLKKTIDLELEQALEFEKKIKLSADTERLNYLKEQSSIAKELKIADNQIDNVNLTQSSVSLSINIADIAYYLRGHRAIDKEIELIKNRNYANLEFAKEEIDYFKKNTEVSFVRYNLYLINSKLLNNKKKIQNISILLGLLFGVFYVLILNGFQSKKFFKTTN